MNALLVSEIIPIIEEVLTISPKDTFNRREISFSSPMPTILMQLFPAFMTIF
jgi:hypothetical protein